MIPLLTEEEAATQLCMSSRSLRELRQRGQIAYVALTTRRIAYRQCDLEEYVAARTRMEAVPVKPQLKGRRRSICATPSGTVVPFSQRKKV